MHDLIKPGSFGPVFAGGHEIVRRIFVTVRDRNWQEVAPTQWETIANPGQRTISVRARHTSDWVDFEWQGALELGADNHSLRFSFEGTARRDMEVCRLGLVVLHAPELMVGSQVRVRSEKIAQAITVPRQLSPQPIVDGVPGSMTEPFAEMSIERGGIGVLKLRFEGDLFELEDQRNWGDASFKSYCTPLRLGYPRAVKEGARVAHSVQLNFKPASQRKVKGTDASATAQTAERPTAFPQLGIEWCSGTPVSAIEGTRSKYRYYHIDATAEPARASVRSLLKVLPQASIELAVDAEDHRVLPMQQLSIVRGHIANISRILVYGPGTGLPSAWAIESWRRMVRELTNTHVPVLAGTRGYFVEFNRRVPLAAETDGIAFPLTATVHSDEPGTVLDNVPTIQDVADTARNLMQPAELAIAPLALYYPRYPEQQNFPPPLILPWVAATMIHAALAGVSSITVAHDLLSMVIDCGVNDADVLLQLAAFGGREVSLPEMTLSAGVHALVIEAGEGAPAQMLVSNLTSQTQRVSLGEERQCIDVATGGCLPVYGPGVKIPGRSVVLVDIDCRTAVTR